jgi:hypothetical protein
VADVAKGCGDQRPLDDLHLGTARPGRPGLMPGLSSGETAELATAKRRIGELETELRAMRRAVKLMARGGAPKEVEAVKVMAAEDIPVQRALRVLDVAVSGYYDWRSRSPPARDPARLAH